MINEASRFTSNEPLLALQKSRSSLSTIGDWNVNMNPSADAPGQLSVQKITPTEKREPLNETALLVNESRIERQIQRFAKNMDEDITNKPFVPLNKNPSVESLKQSHYLGRSKSVTVIKPYQMKGEQNSVCR
jgi:hypothetical protein